MSERAKTSPDAAMIDGHESVVICALMHGRELPVAEDDFASPTNRTIFKAVKQTTNGSVLAVQDELQRCGTLQEVGGIARLTEIACMPSDNGNVEYALGEVLDASCKRRAAEIGKKLQGGVIGPDEALASLASLARNGSADISVRSPDEILKLPRNPRANFLGDWLLAMGQALVIAGIGGIGKTRLLLQLLVAFIIGRAWCGIETHTKTPCCLLLQTENGMARLQRDLDALKKWTGEDWQLVEDKLRIHTLETDTDSMLHLSEPENARRVEAIVRKLNPDILSLDPLRDFGIGDLNSDVDMSATLREIGRVSRVGNPNRALIILHHAITGRAGVAKAFGLERTGFARNSKILHTWARGVVNVVPGAEDDNETLILTCGKNSNGKEFPPVAIRLTDALIYEVADDFDIDGWREHVASDKAAQKKYPVECLRGLKFEGELEIKALAKLIFDKIGCGRTRSYDLVHEGHKAKLFRFDKLTETYAKV